MTEQYEEVVKDGSGNFLAEMWASTQDLPTLSKSEQWGYFFQRGLATIRALPMSNSITIATIAVTLFIFGSVFLSLRALDTSIAEAGNIYDFTVYLKEDIDPTDLNRFIGAVRSNTVIEEVEFLSKEKALSEFRNYLGPGSSFLDGLGEDNPLPASLEVRLSPSGATEKQRSDLLEYLESHQLVSEVVYGSVWVDKARNVLRVFRFMTFVVLLVVLVIVVFLVNNTIKLVIHSRRDEIAVMQLVGASDSFVRLPFILGGMLQGLFGSLIGIALLQVCFYILTEQLKNSMVFGVSMSGVLTVDLPLFIVMLLLGMVIGAMGSFFALGRLMNV